MGAVKRLIVVALAVAFMVVANCRCGAEAQLSTKFYAKTCPKLESVVRSVMAQAVANETRMGASILRLHFHDCFVNGCDGSILLDDTANFTGEKNAGPNANSVRGFEVIDAIKTQVEATCNGTVSCADILALAARDGVNLLGGPTWVVPLGRRDALTASQSAANANLPGPSSSLSTLISNFAAQGLTSREMVVLSGAHTIGQARCQVFRNRIYNDTNINATFASLRQQTCPQSGGNNNLAPIDVQSPTVFDNAYFQNLAVQQGLFHSDQELTARAAEVVLVNNYGSNASAFGRDFAAAVIKMGRINPLLGSSGEIRINCRKVNGG